MAVESTPERSFSDLLRDFPRRRRHHRMHHGLIFGAQMVGLHHLAQRMLEGALRIGQKRRYPREGLFLLRMEAVEDNGR